MTTHPTTATAVPTATKQHPREAELTYRVEIGEWLQEDAALLASMTPADRLQHETALRRAALSRAHRRIATKRFLRDNLIEPREDGTTVADELLTVVAAIADLANSPDTLTAAAANGQLASDIVALQVRAQALVDQAATIMPSIASRVGAKIAYCTPSGAITASMQNLDPNHFARKVKARRRMDALRHARAQQQATTAARRTLSNPKGTPKGDTPIRHRSPGPLTSSSAASHRTPDGRDPLDGSDLLLAMPYEALVCGRHCSHMLNRACPRETEAKRRDRERAADKTELNRAVRHAEEAARRRRGQTGQ